MRKTYIVPSTKVMECESEELLVATGVYSDQGINYGGVDEDGEREADSRHNIWDD